MSKDVETWERLQAYRRGWRDGAASKPKHPSFTGRNDRPDLSEAYDRGHAEGHATYSREVSAEAARLGIDLAAAVIDR